MISRRALLGWMAALGLFAAGAAVAQDADALAENTLVIQIEGVANGVVEIELLPDLAPQHVEQLKSLARAGAYDDVAFHRVIDGFMAQTGDVEFGKRAAFAGGRAGTGGSDLPDLPAEFSGEPFVAGIVGMARSQNPNSANSQFFIMFADAPHLNGQYTAVGRVSLGMDVVNDIRRGKSPNGAVDTPDYMTSVRVKAEQ